MKYLLLFLLFLSVVYPVSAHTLKIDGSIGVTTHVEPDDEPIIGKESRIFISIEDTSGKFKPNNPSVCDCVLHIEKDGQRLQTLPVVSGGSYTQLRYTFSEPGRYILHVEGKPNGTGSPFQAFNTQYSYFIRGGNLKPVEVNVLLTYFPYIVAVVGSMILVMFIDPIRKSSGTTKKGGQIDQIGIAHSHAEKGRSIDTLVRSRGQYRASRRIDKKEGKGKMST